MAEDPFSRRAAALERYCNEEERELRRLLSGASAPAIAAQVDLLRHLGSSRRRHVALAAAVEPSEVGLGGVLSTATVAALDDALTAAVRHLKTLSREGGQAAEVTDALELVVVLFDQLARAVATLVAG